MSPNKFPKRVIPKNTKTYTKKIAPEVRIKGSAHTAPIIASNILKPKIPPKITATIKRSMGVKTSKITEDFISSGNT